MVYRYKECHILCNNTDVHRKPPSLVALPMAGNTKHALVKEEAATEEERRHSGRSTQGKTGHGVMITLCWI